MNENQYSLTAVMCAYLRACHARYDNPRIFEDFPAYDLIPAENRNLIEQGLLQYLQQIAPEQAATFSNQTSAVAFMARLMNHHTNLLSRSHYTESNLETAVSSGVQQYVILGAGLDTFAFRREDMLKRLQVFEVDHPATQNFKKQQIERLGWQLPQQLTFIPLDFTQKALVAALAETTYSQEQKTFYSWLGVTMYLTREKVFATLQSIANISPSGSTVVFDYYDLNMFDPEQSNPRQQERMEMLKQAGEPIITGFHPATLAVDLAEIGLRLCEDLNHEDIQNRYGWAQKHGHLVLAVVA